MLRLIIIYFVTLQNSLIYCTIYWVLFGALIATTWRKNCFIQCIWVLQKSSKLSAEALDINGCFYSPHINCCNPTTRWLFTFQVTVQNHPCLQCVANFLFVWAFWSISPLITHIKFKQSIRVQKEEAHFHYWGGDVYIILRGCYVCCLKHQASKSVCRSVNVSILRR
jgi:hypothetical protein